MSDIPPDLLEQAKLRKSYAQDRCFFRCLLVFVVAMALLFGWVTCVRAETYDPSSTYCELFAQDPDNGRYYIVEDPPWTPTCGHPWVTVRADKFLSLVEAYEGTGSGSASSQFTADEVAALKYQAANPSPFNLSIPDGSLVSGAIAGTWALAWVLKQLVRALNTDGEKENS